MSADLLKRAAAKLREHAEKAQHVEPWCPEYHWAAVRHVQRNVDLDLDCEQHGADCGMFDMYDGRYIALMHPPVALALAGWLAEIANDADQHQLYDPKLMSSFINGWDQAVAVARAILREA